MILPMDCWNLILSHANYHQFLRDTYLTCRAFAKFYETAGRWYKINYQNILTSLISHAIRSDFPKFYKNFSLSSRKYSPKISLEFMELYSDLPWDWDSKLSQCSWNDVKKCHSMITNAHKISNIPNPDWEFIMSNLHIVWNWSYLSKSCTSWNMIERYPDAPWVYDMISPNIIPKQFILDSIELPWSWEQLGLHYQITEPEFIMNNQDLPWVWNLLIAKYFPINFAISQFKSMSARMIDTYYHPDISLDQIKSIMLGTHLSRISEHIAKKYSFEEIFNSGIFSIPTLIRSHYVDWEVIRNAAHHDIHMFDLSYISRMKADIAFKFGKILIECGYTDMKKYTWAFPLDYIEAHPECEWDYIRIMK